MSLLLAASPPPSVQLGWSAEFPDIVRGAPGQAHEAQSVAFVQLVSAAPAAPLLSWAPDYPSDARGARSPDPGWFVRSFLPLPAPPESWRAIYPDFALGRPPVVPVGWLAYVPAIRQWGVPGTTWLPDYPDFARAAPRPPDVGAYTYTNENLFNVRFFPHVVFPDRIDARPRPVDQGIVAYVPATNRWGLVGQFRPIFPDFAGRGLPRPVETGFSVLSRSSIPPPMGPFVTPPVNGVAIILPNPTAYFAAVAQPVASPQVAVIQGVALVQPNPDATGSRAGVPSATFLVGDNPV